MYIFNETRRKKRGKCLHIRVPGTLPVKFLVRAGPSLWHDLFLVHHYGMICS